MLRQLMCLLVLLTAGTSWACKCAGGRLLAPRDGSRGVPTNVILRVSYASTYEPPAVTLVNESDGALVELTPSPGPGAYLTSFTPRAPLTPNTSYTFRAPRMGESRFTTGAGEDHEPPTPVAFSSYEFSRDDMGSCNVVLSWRLRFSGGVDEGTSAQNVLLFAYTTDGGSPEASAGVTNTEFATLSSGLCATTFRPPPDPEHFDLQLQAMDLAGNVSKFAPPKRQSRCATTPGAAVLLALAWLLRRARG